MSYCRSRGAGSRSTRVNLVLWWTMTFPPHGKGTWKCTDGFLAVRGGWEPTPHRRVGWRRARSSPARLRSRTSDKPPRNYRPRAASPRVLPGGWSAINRRLCGSQRCFWSHAGQRIRVGRAMSSIAASGKICTPFAGQVTGIAKALKTDGSPATGANRPEPKRLQFSGLNLRGGIVWVGKPVPGRVPDMEAATLRTVKFHPRCCR